MNTFKVTMFLFCLFSSQSFAITRAQKEAHKTDMRNAKAICLMKQNFLRGPKLKECMDLEIEKKRQSDQAAKIKAIQNKNRHY